MVGLHVSGQIVILECKDKGPLYKTTSYGVSEAKRAATLATWIHRPKLF